MSDFMVPVDPFSESVMALESDSYPKTDFTQFQFRGKVEFSALAKAFEETIADVPTFGCHLTERREGFHYQPYWVKPEGLTNRLIFEDCRHLINGDFDPMAFATLFHAHRMNRRLDLFNEFPVQCFLAQVEDERFIFAIVYHHSALDGLKAFKLMNGMLRRYHKKVKGEDLEWTHQAGMTSLATRAKEVKPQSYLKFAKDQLPEIFQGSKVEHIKTMGVRDVRGRHSVRGIVDDKNAMKGILARAKKNNATLNDLMLVVAHRTIRDWNRCRNAKGEFIKLMLVSNLRMKVNISEHAGAGLSAITYPMQPYNSLDFDNAIQAVRDRRIAQLAIGNDVAFYHFVSGLMRKARVLPMRMRHTLLKPVTGAAQCSLSLSNVGVVWPKVVNGQPTFESMKTGAGDFIIDDMHSSPSLGRALGLGLVVRTYRGKFFLNFTTDRFRFRFEEMIAFRDAFMENLLGCV